MAVSLEEPLCASAPLLPLIIPLSSQGCSCKQDVSQTIRSKIHFQKITVDLKNTGFKFLEAPDWFVWMLLNHAEDKLWNWRKEATESGWKQMFILL